MWSTSLLTTTAVHRIYETCIVNKIYCFPVNERWMHLRIISRIVYTYLKTYAISSGFWFTIKHEKIKINCYLCTHQKPKEILDWHGDWNVCTCGLLSMTISDWTVSSKHVFAHSTSRAIALSHYIILYFFRVDFPFTVIIIGNFVLVIIVENQKNCVSILEHRNDIVVSRLVEIKFLLYWDPYVLHSVGINWLPPA